MSSFHFLNFINQNFLLNREPTVVENARELAARKKSQNVPHQNEGVKLAEGKTFLVARQ